MSTTIKEKVSNLIRQWEGPLTRQLLLEPGNFGLGKVPEKLKPGCYYFSRLRLLLNRMQSQYSPKRRRSS